MARTTDIYCKDCGSKGKVTKTERIHSNFSKLYCTCRNPHCGHKWVMNLEYSHTTRTSQLTKDELFRFIVGKLSDHDKQELVKVLNDKSR